MKIDFLVNEVAGGWEPTDDRLGGTELSVVKWAEELAERGHEVHVFRNGRDDRWKEIVGDAGSLNYWPREMYRGGGDVCINVKSSDIAPKEPTLYLTNETNASALYLSAYDGVIWPSQWAADNIPVNNKNVYILPHGYDPKELYPEEKIPKMCLYASSPDRGLDALLEAWPKVYAKHPDAQLYVTYGAKYMDIPGVVFMGAVDTKTMDELYRMADVWCHPCKGGELYCITGINAQVSGCVPVIIPTMALAETVRHGIFATKEDYAEILTNVLGDEPLKSEIRAKLAAEKYPTWEDTAIQLEKLCRKVL